MIQLVILGLFILSVLAGASRLATVGK